MFSVKISTLYEELFPYAPLGVENRLPSIFFVMWQN